MIKRFSGAKTAGLSQRSNLALIISYANILTGWRSRWPIGESASGGGKCIIRRADSFVFDLLAATDGAEIFPYGAMIKISTGRTPVSGPTATPAGLPLAGVLSWTGGQTWFAGWRMQNIRTGTPRMEGFKYKFAGPWDFFFERLVFQKLWLSWNTALTGQIADWRSQVMLGQCCVAADGAGNTVTGTTGTHTVVHRAAIEGDRGLCDRAEFV